MPLTLASLRPTFSTVSIIPGMENCAPERTLTSSGSCRSPSRRPVLSSRCRSAIVTCTRRSPGSEPRERNSRQASVLMVNPGGTGRPSLVISARFAPLPPSSAFWSLSPSVKSYTYLVNGVLLGLVSGRSTGSLRREPDGDVDDHVLLTADVTSLADLSEYFVRRHTVSVRCTFGVQKE